MELAKRHLCVKCEVKIWHSTLWLSTTRGNN